MIEEKKLWESELGFDYFGTHECSFVALGCMDFRMWEDNVEFLKKGFGIDSFDFVNLPGAGKAINESEEEDIVNFSLKVAFEKHNAQGIVVINHNDCGAYGGSGKFNNPIEEKDFHKEELLKCHQIIKKRFPDKKIVLIYAEVLNDNTVQYLQFTPDKI